MSVYTQLLNNLETLSLSKMKEVLPGYLDKAVASQKPAVEIMLDLYRRLETSRVHKLKIVPFAAVFLYHLDDLAFHHTLR